MRHLFALLLTLVLSVGGVPAQIAPGVPPSENVETGIVASTTQTQGQQPLTANVSVVATVANDGDVVTAPPAVVGVEVSIFNEGVNTLQVYPTSGDDLGAGVDASVEIEPNESREWVAFDGTTYGTEASTAIMHAEMFDFDNTDAFVVSDAGGDDTAYHTNGLAAGDLAGWTFDAGGAGTSIAITVVADGAASGVDIEVTAVAHGLAVGDIVTQTNLANAAYVGFFVVKAIIDVDNYEVAAVFTATGTGTMDQAATLIADTGSAGDYLVLWSASSTAASNNDIFDFAIHIEAVHQDSTNTQRKFGIAADIGDMSGVSIITIADGDHVSFMIVNATPGSGNITLRNFTLVLVRL